MYVCMYSVLIPHKVFVDTEIKLPILQEKKMMSIIIIKCCINIIFLSGVYFVYCYNFRCAALLKGYRGDRKDNADAAFPAE